MNTRRNQGIAARPGIFIVDGAAVFILSGGSQHLAEWRSAYDAPAGRDPEVWLRQLLDRASDARVWSDKQRIQELLVDERNIARARIDRRRTARSLFLAVFLALHGVAHFVGTTDSLRLASQSGSASYAGGRWTISDPLALQMIAVLWAVTGTFFVAVAILVWLKPSSARIPLAVAAVGSLILSVAALPAAIVGVVIDIVLLLVVWRPPRTLLGPRNG